MIEVFQSDLKMMTEGLGKRVDGLEQRFDRFEKGTKDNFEVVKEYLFKIDYRLN